MKSQILSKFKPAPASLSQPSPSECQPAAVNPKCQPQPSTNSHVPTNSASSIIFAKRIRRVRQSSLNGGSSSTSSTILTKRTPRVRQSSLSGSLNSTRSAILAQLDEFYFPRSAERSAMGQEIKKQLLAQALSVKMVPPKRGTGPRRCAPPPHTPHTHSITGPRDVDESHSHTQTHMHAPTWGQKSVFVYLTECQAKACRKDVVKDDSHTMKEKRNWKCGRRPFARRTNSEWRE